MKIHYLLIGAIFMSPISYATKPDNFQPKPYVVFDMDTKNKPKVLDAPAAPLIFPLSKADLEDIQTLEQQFDHEANCAGLAAVQIGIAKRIIVFAAPENPELKKWRPDFTQSMPKTIWINPSYEGIQESGIQEDFEGCFSVAKFGGIIPRYKKIKYNAFDMHGKEITGTAEGFLARIIQHEIDHINGKLCIERANKIISIEEYRKKRKAELEEAGGASQ